MKTVAVAGCDGFIGSNLIRVLSQSGYTIIPIDVRNGMDLTKWQEVKGLPVFDVFVHLANLTYVPASYEHPLDFYTINYLTTLHALELCRQRNAKCIYISSYIYGNPEYLPVDEQHAIHPFNPYAQTKYIGESLCRGYYRDFKVISTILRPFNIFGPFQKGDMLIPSIVRQLKRRIKVIQLKDPSPRRDYVYVMDVVNAIKSCIDTDIEQIQAFNICSGKSYSVLEMTEIIKSLLPYQVSFRFDVSDRKNEVSETIGSYDKIKALTAWSPEVDFNEGIKNILIAEEII